MPSTTRRWAGALGATGLLAIGLVMPSARAGAAIGAVLDPMISVRVQQVADDPGATIKVDAIAKLGSTVYVGGQFTEMAPEREPTVTVPAGKGIPRAYLFAVDATTGNPVWSFAPQLDGPVYALEVDAVTNTLYVGGNFDTVNGQPVANFAVLDATTGALKGTQFVVGGATNAEVRAIVLHNLTRKLYVGGDFTTVAPTPPGNARNRGELFRLDLATNTVDDYKIQVTGTVLSIALDPDAATPPFVYVGGEFSKAGPTPGDPSFGYLAAFATTPGPAPDFFGALRTAWDPDFGTINPNNPPRVRSLVIKGTRLYVAVGGGGGRFGVFDTADGAVNPVLWRTDGDVQAVEVVGTQVLIGGHFTRITNLASTIQGQSASFTLRCQVFAVPLAVGPTDAPLATPNVLNSAHYGPFAIVAEGTDGDLNTYWGGHLGRISNGPDPTDYSILSAPHGADNGACGTGVGNTWGGLWHLRDTPQPDSTKPNVTGTPTATTSFTTATVSWAPASDANGISAYYLYLNGAFTAMVAGNLTTASLTGLIPDAVNTIRVRAVDPGTNFRDYPQTTVIGGQAIPPLPNPLNGFGQFFPSTNPVRVLDTRTGVGRPGTAPLAGGTPLSVPIVGALSGVPADAQLVAMNVTVVSPSSGGYLTVAPTGVTMPTVSNLNFRAGQTVANLVVARVGTGGSVDVQLNSGTAHVLFDVVGWFGSGTTNASGSRLVTQTPVRKLDSRSGLGMPGGLARPIGPAETIEVVVADPGMKAVVLNLTGVVPTQGTYVTAYPGAQARPDASSLNLTADTTRPNLVMVGVSPTGTIKLYNDSGSVHLLIDVVATFGAPGALDSDPSGRVLALDRPERMVDTRGKGEALGSGAETTRSFAALAAAAPAPLRGVVMNVTATQASASTYLTLYPPDAPRPNASNLNVGPGEDVPNLVVGGLSTADATGIFNASGTVDYLFDVTALVLG